MDAASQDEPTCTCDAAYYFSSPINRDQELCKELVPSVAYLRHYTEPFTVSSDLLDLYVDIGAWALFTLEVRDEWEVLVATLEAKTLEADAMLFVRKEKLPTTVVDSTSATASSSVQYTDTASWTAGEPTRKVVLSRASSTLSSGLYYVGVYNSPYGRASLGYSLVVNATGSCSGSTSSSGSSSSDTAEDPFGICENGGVCNALATDICTCPDMFAGKFCGLNVSRLSLASPPSSSWASYVSLNTSNMTLGIGGWNYFSFDVEQTSARLAQIELVIANRLSIPTPARPLLLVRSPSDSDFPTLYSDALQDFAGVQGRSRSQVVPLAIESAACSFSANHKHCYKVAVHNRATAGAALVYALRVTLFSSLSAAYPSAAACVSSSSSSSSSAQDSTCLGRGTCALVQDPDDSTAVLPSCTCGAGWSGLRCGSPTSIAASQLWTALRSLSLLCSSCSSAPFSLSRGQVRVFRVPEPLRANVGLRLAVEPVGASAAVPSVYVSEFMPRSVSDFSYISTGAGAALELTSGSLSGHFWVVVYAELAPASAALSAGVGRLLAAADATFRLVAAPFPLPAASAASALLSERSFESETLRWLAHSPLGVASLAAAAVALALALCFCLWRVARAPEHRDELAARHFGLKPRAVALAPLAAVVDAIADADADADAVDADVDAAAVEMGLMAPATRRCSA